MKFIKPFRGLRPTRELAADIASHPYDVLNREEAFALAHGNPLSFLHVNKPEIDVAPEVSPYDPSVYAKGRENLDNLVQQGALVRDSKETLYVYRQIMGEHIQTGIVAVASVDAYEADLIKKHEFTRPDKEDDRVRHMDALGAQVGPVFVTYEAQAQVDVLVAEIVLSDPDYDFEAEDGTHHTFGRFRKRSALRLLRPQSTNWIVCMWLMVITAQRPRPGSATCTETETLSIQEKNLIIIFWLCSFLMTRCKYWITTGPLKILATKRRRHFWPNWALIS